MAVTSISTGFRRAKNTIDAERHAARGLAARLVSALAILIFALQPGLAWAGQGVLPTGGTVAQGTASIAPTAGGLGITQSSGKAILNWQSFSIGAGQKVTINNGAGATLNRVTGADASTIAGKLQSTGTVYLINPAGIVIGPNGKVITGGSFVGSTRDLANADFMAGKTQNFSGTGTGDVTNNGAIISKDGSVALIGSSVVNNGTVSAAQGVVAMAAGDQVLLDPSAGDGRILVATSGGKDVTNSGAISAAAIQLTAAQGNVYALAGNSGTLHATGTATIGGHVWLTGGDTTEIAGDVTAVNADGSGGTIVATAPKVQVDKTATVTADGTSGGTILIGGDRGGSADAAQKLVSATVTNAKTTNVAAGAVISAKGTTGNGGDVVVWSDEKSDFDGVILAGSAASAALGGFSEVSSHGLLNFAGSVNTTGKAATAGTLLIDPSNLTIVASGDSSANGTSILTNDQVETLLANGNVVLATGNSGNEAGDINVNASFGWGGITSLTMNAYHDIDVASGVTITNTGSGNLALRADATSTGSGTVNLLGNIDASGSTGNVAILYNPAGGYTTPTDYSSQVATNSAIPGQLAAYMLVNTASDLQNIGTNLSGTYALGQTIDGQGAAFTPLASSSTPFTGTLNGFGNSISNFSITDGTTDDVGFFRYTRSGSVIENTTFANFTLNIDGATGGGGVPEGGAGIVAGSNGGLIANVTVSGQVNSTVSTGRGIAGIAGINSGTIEGSLNQADITSSYGYLAGVAGGNYGTIAGTGSTGTVTSDRGDETIGGLVTSNFGTIYQSFVTGNVSGGSGSNIGDLVAVNYATVNQSFATGTATTGGSSGNTGSYNGTTVGGLVGWNVGGTVTDSYATGNVSGGAATGNEVTAAGGAIGENSASATNVYALGTVTGGSDARAGAVIGSNDGSASGVYYDSSLSGQTPAIGGGGGSSSNVADVAGAPNSLSSYPTFSASVWGTGSATSHPVLLWQASTGLIPVANTAPASGGGSVPNPISTGSSQSVSTNPYLPNGNQSAGLGALSAGELSAAVNDSANVPFPSSLLDQYAISPNEVYNPIAAEAQDATLDLMISMNGLAPGSNVFATGVSSAGVTGISSGGVTGPSSAGVTGISSSGAYQASTSASGLTPGSNVFAYNMSSYGALSSLTSPSSYTPGSVTGYDTPTDQGVYPIEIFTGFDAGGTQAAPSSQGTTQQAAQGGSGNSTPDNGTGENGSSADNTNTTNPHDDPSPFSSSNLPSWEAPSNSSDGGNTEQSAQSGSGEQGTGTANLVGDGSSSDGQQTATDSGANSSSTSGMTPQQMTQAATMSQIQLMYTQSSTQANDPGSNLSQIHSQTMPLNLINMRSPGISAGSPTPNMADIVSIRQDAKQVTQALNGLSPAGSSPGTFTVISVSPSPGQANAQAQVTAAQQQAAAQQAAQQTAAQALGTFAGQ